MSETIKNIEAKSIEEHKDYYRAHLNEAMTQIYHKSLATDTQKAAAVGKTAWLNSKKAAIVAAKNIDDLKAIDFSE